nr:hypothetical protein [Rahnella aquatilis]
MSKLQRSFDPTKTRDVAPSARLTAEERARLPEIERELMKCKITAARWVPYLGYAQAVIICAFVAKDTRDKYNLIAYPQDRIAWTYF